MLVMPFRLKGQIAMPRKVQFRRLDAEELAAIPAPVQGFLDSAEPQAARAGFHEPIRHGYGAPDRPTPGPYLSIMPARSGESIFVAFGSHTPRRLTLSGAALQTRLVDGTVIRTGNESLASGPQRPPRNFDDVNFAGMNDLGRLCDIHRRRVARAIDAGGVVAPLGWSPAAMHPLDLMQRAFDEGLVTALEKGRVEVAGDEIRFTLKGAALSAWSLSWPLRQLVDRAERRRATRVLREIGG